MKNAIVYRTATETSGVDAETFVQALAEFPFKAPTDRENRRIGFIPPFKHSAELSMSFFGYIAFAVFVAERKLPKAAIDEMVAKEVAEFELHRGMTPSRAERQRIKEEIVDAIRPTVIPTKTRVGAYIDTRRHLIVVDTSSAKCAEQVLDLLRQALGSLKCMPLVGLNNHSRTMTEWARTDRPLGDLGIGTEFKLKTDDQSAAYKGVDVESQTVKDALDSGMRVVEMRLVLGLVGDFTLKSSMHICRLDFDDKLFGEVDEIEDEAAAEQAGFIIESAAVGEILGALDEPMRLSLGQPLVLEESADATP